MNQGKVIIRGTKLGNIPALSPISHKTMRPQGAYYINSRHFCIHKARQSYFPTQLRMQLAAFHFISRKGTNITRSVKLRDEISTKSTTWNRQMHRCGQDTIFISHDWSRLAKVKPVFSKYQLFLNQSSILTNFHGPQRVSLHKNHKSSYLILAKLLERTWKAAIKHDNLGGVTSFRVPSDLLVKIWVSIEMVAGNLIHNFIGKETQQHKGNFYRKTMSEHKESLKMLCKVVILSNQFTSLPHFPCFEDSLFLVA